MPTANGTETDLEKLARIRGELAVLRASILRFTKIGASASTGAFSHSSHDLEKLYRRQAILEREEFALIRKVYGGPRRQAIGIMRVRNSQYT